MATVIAGDVHSNLEALRAVLAHAEARGPVDAVWCPGDIVGYGPDPSAVLAELRGPRLTAVAGNHDFAACGRMDTNAFNRAAARAAEWTAAQLSIAEVDFLHSLRPTVVVGDFTIVHGTLREPVWEYLLSDEEALLQFELQQTPYSIVGHSHLPFWIEETAAGETPRFRGPNDGTTLGLGERRLIVNPGSVGQPRDGDPRASYVLYDDRAATLTWHRVDYDIAETQRKMRLAGLDAWLIERLSVGM
jgi:diadenosine tetraphosphatase ApaH/serine/threonine PP2A family protein phosphatase